MSSLRRAVPLFSAIVALALSACASPFLKTAANTPDPKPSNALVAGMNVRFDNGGQDKGLIGAAVDAAQNSQLDEFGKKATDMLAAALAERGYTAAYDGPRSQKLDVIEIAANSTSAALTGTWRNPQTSHWTPDTVDSLFHKPSDVITKLKVEGQKEYFAFAEVVIRDSGMFMKEPYVVVRASIYDQDAKKVLDLQGIGSGDSSFMFSNRSPQNLQLALQRGFDSLKTVNAQTL